MNNNEKHYLSQWQTIDHLKDYNLVRNTRTYILGESRKYKLDPKYDPDS